MWLGIDIGVAITLLAFPDSGTGISDPAVWAKLLALVLVPVIAIDFGRVKFWIDDESKTPPG